MKVYFFVSHPIQYFVPLYQKLSEETEVQVFFYTNETIEKGTDRDFGVEVKWDIPLLEGYKYHFLKNHAIRPSVSGGFWGLLNHGIVPLMFRLPKGMVVVNGWQYASDILSLVVAKLAGHKTALRGESPDIAEYRLRTMKNSLRRFFLEKFLLRHLVDYCFYIGTNNRGFYKMYGVPDTRLVFSPYSIDTSRFNAVPDEEVKRKLRQSKSVPEDGFIILFTAKFIPRKRPMDLVRAFQILNNPDYFLVLAGDGELREGVKKYIEEHKIENISLPGFINQNEIVDYYQLADVMVLCSEFETWGLSVNEALACGLPVIVSDRVGCAKDLVNDSSGRIYKMGDVHALAHAIGELAELNGSDKEKLQERVKVKSAMYDISKSAAGILSVVSR